MSAKRLVQSAPAQSDVEAAVEDYFREAGADVARRFIGTIEASFRIMRTNSTFPDYAAIG